MASSKVSFERTPLNDIVLFGALKGKGAQAERIASLYGMVHCLPAKCYDLPFLQVVMWVQGQRNYRSGELISDDIIVKIVDARMDEGDCVKGVARWLSRTVAQAEALDEIWLQGTEPTM